jgi:outer membrane protein TolC
MIIKQAESAATMAQYEVAKASRLPSAGGWANYLRTEDDRNEVGGARPASKLGYYFSIRQPLYYWGNIQRGVRNAEIQTLIDQGNTRAAYMTLAGDIRKYYMELIIQRQALAKHRFHAEIREKELEETREKRAQNLNSEADLYAALLAHERAQLDLMEWEDRFDYGIKVYSRLTGRPPLTEDQVPLEFPPAPGDQTERLVAMATRFLAVEMPENTNIQIAKKQIEISENNLENTKTNLRPRFDLIAGISQDEQDFALSTDKYQYRSIFGGISLNWNIFDGFATKARVKSELARLRASEARLVLEQQELLDDVERLGREIKRKGMAVHINERELQSARNHLEYTRGRAERGEASEAEVNAAVLNLEERLGYSLFSRFDYWNKVSQFLGLIEADPVLNRVPAPIE